MNYKIKKEYTDNYSYIDKQMFYLSLYNMYSNHSDVAISRNTIYISEGKLMNVKMYSSLLDLPVIDVPTNIDINVTKTELENIITKQDLTEPLILTIEKSIDKFYIIKQGNKYYITRMYICRSWKTNYFINEISDYLSINRMTQLTNII